MHDHSRTLRRAIALSLVALLASACTFEHGAVCDKLEELPTTPLLSQTATVVINAPNTLEVVHGSGCARKNDGDYLKVEQSVDFPPFVNRATVFVNGWQLKYLQSDHHVSFLGTTLGKIALERNTLRWNAIGRLAEDGADEPFEWCYRFTALGWNDPSLAAVVDHDDALDFCTAGTGSNDNFYVAQNDSAETALASFRSFVQNNSLIGSRTIAVLPRGFGIGFSTDHHLLQLAYNLDHADSFVVHRGPYYQGPKQILLDLPNDAHRVGDGYVAYQTYAILKDNRARRPWGFGEIVSAMGGADVHVVQPPFAILPVSPADQLVGTTTDQEIVIENVPYEFAIPMLTAWEVGFPNDQHVQEVGTWIDELQWQKVQGAPAGTLRYKFFSRLRDKNGSPGHYARHKVSILGLRAAQGRLPGGPAGPQAPPAGQEVPQPTPAEPAPVQVPPAQQAPMPAPP